MHEYAPDRYAEMVHCGILNVQNYLGSYESKGPT